jgi:hypothetical protein
MRHSFVLAVVCALFGLCNGELGFMEEEGCGMVKGDWCFSRVVCTDTVTDEVVHLTRVRKLVDYAPVDTSKVYDVRQVCNSNNLDLPSIHSDLENW